MVKKPDPSIKHIRKSLKDLQQHVDYKTSPERIASIVRLDQAVKPEPEVVIIEPPVLEKLDTADLVAQFEDAVRKEFNGATFRFDDPEIETIVKKFRASLVNLRVQAVLGDGEISIIATTVRNLLVNFPVPSAPLPYSYTKDIQDIAFVMLGVFAGWTVQLFMPVTKLDATTWLSSFF